MKIALVNDMAYRYASGDPRAVGGSERYQWLFARALAAHGWSAVIGVPTALAPGRRVTIDGVEFVGFRAGQFFVALHAFLTTERPNWCFWFGSTHLLGPAVLIGAMTRTRSAFAAQFDLDVFPRRALTERRAFWPLYALGLAGSRKIFLQHHQQLADLPQRWKRKAHVLPGVVNVPDASVPHASRDPYVAWVGVLRQPKRPDLLVEIARRCPSIKFKVCGGASAHRSPPGYGEALIAQLQGLPNIEYLGPVAPARAIDIIGQAALLLSTSEAEGYPSVFLEAWSQGTPVVSLSIDPDHAIAERGLGLVPPSLDAAAHEIELLVSSPQRREAIALRAREYAIQNHSGRAVAALVEQLLQGPAATLLPASENV